jgi:hypothetical protein
MLLCGVDVTPSYINTKSAFTFPPQSYDDKPWFVDAALPALNPSFVF